MRRLRVGARALLVELDADREVMPTYRHITSLIAAGQLPPARDLVPAARTILVDGVDPDAWWGALNASAPAERSPDESTSGARVTIAIRYDGDDLDEVARQWDCDRGEVVRRHRETEFTVAFCGFAPGFAYCRSDPALPEVSRREDPRTRVPIGAVGLAGPYCGIYPAPMPGGWQLIGSTDEPMFDPSRDQPALLRPDDRVAFAEIEPASVQTTLPRYP